MKKCPQCKKLVRSNAIDCPFCGASIIKPQPFAKPQLSVWTIGAIAAAIVTAIGAVYIIFEAPNVYELIGSLIGGLFLGSLLNFVVLELIFTFTAWALRKIGLKTSNTLMVIIVLITPLLVLGLLLLFIPLVFILFSH